MLCCPTMMQAAKSSHPECLSWHLKHGGSLSGLFRYQHARVPRPLHEAAGAKPTKGQGPPSCTLCVEAVLAAGADVGWLDEKGRSPLQRAAMVGCVSCIETLLRPPTSAKVDAICGGSTALLEAVRVNSEAAVRALLLSKASVAQLTNESRPLAPLIEAVKSGAYDCIIPLVEAGAALTTDFDGPSYCSPLWVAAASEEEGRTADGVIRLLVKLGADVSASWHDNGQSVIHASASRGRRRCMEVLLELGADPVASDKEGSSPLHLAAANSHVDACQLLVEHITEASGPTTAADALLLKDNKRRTPLYLAVESRRDQAALCVSRLLEMLQIAGGSQAVSTALTETAGGKGWTVVHLAAGLRKHADSFRVFTEVPEGLRVALEIKDNDGKTPAALAQETGHELDHIPGFSQRPWAPCCGSVFEAAEKCHVTCAKGFLDDSACVTQGKDGVSPLALVDHGGQNRITTNCSKIVRALLEAGFDPDGCRGDGSPLLCSTFARDGFGDICTTCSALLIKHGGAKSLFKAISEDDERCAMFGILKFASYGGDEEKQLARAALVACNLGDDGIGATHLFTWVGRGFDCFEFPRLLAAAGVEAGMEATTELGETALHIAAELPDYQEEDWEDGDEDYPRDSDNHVELMEWLVSKVG